MYLSINRPICLRFKRVYRRLLFLYFCATCEFFSHEYHRQVCLVFVQHACLVVVAPFSRRVSCPHEYHRQNGGGFVCFFHSSEHSINRNGVPEHNLSACVSVSSEAEIIFDDLDVLTLDDLNLDRDPNMVAQWALLR